MSQTPIRQAKQALLSFYGQHPCMGSVGIGATAQGQQCLVVGWDEEDHPLPRTWMGWPVRVVPTDMPRALQCRRSGPPGKALVWLSVASAVAAGALLGLAASWLTARG